MPFTTAAANAAYVTRTLVDTYLITHPHLDHISAFVINTAGLPGSRPKKLAGLPATIQALKTHIFNNVIWPNLSDENNGAGLLTYLRLVDGGSPALGDGEGKGYLEVCDGLLVKTWGVSHGHCMEKHSHRGSASGASTRFGSHDASSQMGRRDTYGHLYPPELPIPMARRETYGHLYTGPPSISRRQSMLGQGMYAGGGSPQFAGMDMEQRACVYDSSAYFIQEPTFRREVLIFGDVEPDSISLSPRNLLIWQEAAPKIAAGTLSAIFIECSYDDSQSNDRLYGHLKPIFVMEEMEALANEVEIARKAQAVESNKKRKRVGADEGPDTYRRPAPASMQSPGPEEPVSPKSAKPFLHVGDYLSANSVDQVETPHLATPTGELSLNEFDTPAAAAAVKTGGARRPLDGLKVIIIHVKDKLSDGLQAGDIILQQLNKYEEEAQLGCEFIISKSGQSFYV